MKKMKLLVLLVLAFTTTIGAAQDVKIGVLYPLTGPVAQVGKDAVAAVETAVDIINTLSAAQAVDNLPKALRRYTSPRLLVIDEMGYLPMDKRGADLLFQVISARYERGAIILTTNTAYKKWARIFNNDSTITAAVLDRLVHHCETVTIHGKSYRMKDKPENEG